MISTLEFNKFFDYSINFFFYSGDPEHNYPLAWLKEAEVEHSNFSLFLAPGSEVPDVGDEDGEIADAQEKLRYDTEKLYEWPGFNAPLDSNFEDQTKDYR